MRTSKEAKREVWLVGQLLVWLVGWLMSYLVSESVWAEIAFFDCSVSSATVSCRGGEGTGLSINTAQPAYRLLYSAGLNPKTFTLAPSLSLRTLESRSPEPYPAPETLYPTPHTLKS